MNSELFLKAQLLANRDYYPVLRHDITTAGEPIILAFHIELDGCLSQGNTPEQAIENLRLARLDYIYGLLEDNLPVPDPISYQQTLVLPEIRPIENRTLQVGFDLNNSSLYNPQQNVSYKISEIKNAEYNSKKH